MNLLRSTQKQTEMLALPFPLLPLILCNTLLITCTTALTDSFVYGGCSRIQYVPNSQYETNVNSLLTSLVNSAMATPYNKFTIGSDSTNVVSGLYQCRGDLSQSDCTSCVQHALSQLGALCAASCGGAIQLDGCLIKYDNATFLGVEDKTVVVKKCGGDSAGYSSDDLARRDEVLGYIASGSSAFYRIGSSGNVHGVAQCVGDLSVKQCQDCLGYAIGELKSSCGPASRADMFLAKCYVRVSNAGAHSNGSNGSSQDDEIEKTLAILIGLIAGVALLIIFLAFIRKLCEGKDGK